MRLARILGAIGRTLIATGVILMLFAAYQLWGTGIQEARAQSSLDDDFDELLAEFESLEVPDGTDATGSAAEAAADPTPGAAEPAGAGEEPPQAAGAAEDPPQAADGTTIPTAVGEAEQNTSDAVWTESMLSLLYPGNGDPVARIDIDKIGVSKFVVEGVRVDDLRKGPGHYVNTPMPGTAGNVAIAGHRTTYGAPFHRIDELDPGDLIRLTTLLGTFTYEVMPQVDAAGQTSGHFIVSPSDVGVLNDFGDNRVTLTACHPKYSASQRIIVVAQLVEEPVPVPPRPVAAGDAAGPTLATEDFSGGASDAEAEPVDTTDSEIATEPVGGAASEADQDDPVAGQPVAVDAAAPIAVADDGFGEGLNGDRQAIAPAVSWMLAALAVWMAATFIGRRWKRWPMWLVAVTPFLILLFISFTHIDQALPSY